MTKSIASKVTALVIVLILFGLGLAVGIISKGFTDWSTFERMFTYAGNKIDEEISSSESKSVVARNSGLVHDSDFSTYAVTKYAKPILQNNEFITRHYSGYAHGSTLHIEYATLSGTVIKGIDYTYSAAAPSYGDGGCSHGKYQLKATDISALTSENIVKVRAWNVGSGSILSSDVAEYVFYLYRGTYTFAGTTLTIPRVCLGDYTANFEIYVADYENTLNDLTLGNHPEVTIEGNCAVNVGTYHCGNYVSNSPAITASTNAYYVDLSKLSFVENVKEINSVYIVPTQITSTDNATYNGAAVSGVLYDSLDFRFSISKLASPTNIRLEGNLLKWNEVAGAQGYAVFDGDTVLSTSLTEPAIDVLSELSAGEHTFRIRALGNLGQQIANASAYALNAENASLTIQRYYVLTYNVSGDTSCKFVLDGDNISDYLYNVDVKDGTFGGWYYDDKYTNAVGKEDKVNKDTTIYAKIVAAQKPDGTQSVGNWWTRDNNKWYVLGPVIGVVGVIIVGLCVSIIRKRR